MPKTYRTNKAPWEKIRAEYESGDITSLELAVKWQIKAATIRKRAAREKWHTPARFKKVMEDVVSMAQGAQGFKDELARLSRPESGEESGPKMSHRVTTSTEPSVYQALVAELAMKAVSHGLAKVKVPANWREISVADGMARRALGLDAKGGGGATAMIRITGGVANPMDIAVGVQGADEPEDYYGEAE